MFKKFWAYKHTQYALNTMGIFSLASFLMLGANHLFIMDMLSECYYDGEIIFYITCGQGIASNALAIFLQLFNPILLPSFFFNIMLMIFLGSDLPTIALGAGLFLALILSWATAMRFIAISTRQFLNAQKLQLNILFMLFAVVTPLFLVSSTKFLIAPPKYSNKIVSIDMWHDQFFIPRKHLERWTIKTSEKPDKPVTGFERLTIRNKKISPFFTFIIPHEISQAMGLENTDSQSVWVSPHHEILAENYLYLRREAGLKLSLSSKYSQAPTQEGLWLVYKNQDIEQIYEGDIYVMRDSNHHISLILKCTASHAYLETRGKHINTVACKPEEDCAHKKRNCHEIDSSDQNYIYSFPTVNKAALNEYPENREKLLKLINSYKK